MFSTKRWVSLFALLIVGGLILSACGPAPTPEVIEKVVTQVVKETVIVEGTPKVVEKVVTATPEPAEPSGASGTVVVSQETDAQNLDPILGTDSHASQNVYHQICEGLVEFHAFTGEAIPVLATEWELVDDYTWHFKIRRGVKFHNGDEMTVEDVAYSFNRILTAPRTNLYTCKQVMQKDEETGLGGGATAIDEDWVEIKLNAIFPAFLDACLSDVDIVNKKVVEEIGLDEHNLHPVCTGPYKFVEWVRDDHLTMEAFEDYWGEPPKVKTIIWKPIPDNAARVAALEAGDTDIVVNVPPLDADRFDEDPNDGIYMSMDFGRRNIYIGVNTFLEPFHDIRVRHAVAYAIDKEAIVNEVLNGHGRLLGSHLVPANQHYLDLAPWPYDLEKAKELLQEAGWEDMDGDGVAECHGCTGPEGFYKEGDELVIDFESPTGRYNMDREVAEAVAGMLAQAGFKVNHRPMEFSAFIQIYNGAKPDPETGEAGGKTRDKGNNGLYLLGSGKRAVPDEYFTKMWHSEGMHYYYENPEMDALIDKATGTYDEEERARLWADVQRMAYDEAFMINLYQQQDLYGVRDRVKFSATRDEYLWLHSNSGGLMVEIVK
jgi:peptide/nickel transport system substrate-binding protein